METGDRRPKTFSWLLIASWRPCGRGDEALDCSQRYLGLRYCDGDELEPARLNASPVASTAFPALY